MIPLGVEHVVRGNGERVMAAIYRLLTHAKTVAGDDCEPLDFIVVGVPNSYGGVARAAVQRGLDEAFEMEVRGHGPDMPAPGEYLSDAPEGDGQR